MPFGVTRSTYAEPMETATSERRPPARALAPERADAPSTADRIVAALPGVAAALVIIVLGVADGGYYATSWGPLTIFFLAAALARARPTSPAQPRSLVAGNACTARAPRALDACFVLVGIAERSGPGGATYSSRTRRVRLRWPSSCGLGESLGFLSGSGRASSWFARTVSRLDCFPSIWRSSTPSRRTACQRRSDTGMPSGSWPRSGCSSRSDWPRRSRRLLSALRPLLPLVPLALTCYFTFSRGAWLALVAGFVVALVLDPGRLRLEPRWRACSLPGPSSPW